MEMSYPAMGPMGAMPGMMGKGMPTAMGKGMMIGQPMMKTSLDTTAATTPDAMTSMTPDMILQGMMMHPGMMQNMMKPGMMPTMTQGMLQQGMTMPGMMQKGTVPAQGQMTVMMPMQATVEVMNSLMRGLNDISLQSAAVSLASYIAEARNLPGLEALMKANQEAAYHMLTAMGAAQIIMMGMNEPRYYAVLVNCQREAQQALQAARTAFQLLNQATPQSLRPWVQQVSGLMQATSGHLQRSVSLTNSALGTQGVQQVMQMIQRADID